MNQWKTWKKEYVQQVEKQGFTVVMATEENFSIHNGEYPVFSKMYEIHHGFLDLQMDECTSKRESPVILTYWQEYAKHHGFSFIAVQGFKSREMGKSYEMTEFDVMPYDVTAMLHYDLALDRYSTNRKHLLWEREKGIALKSKEMLNEIRKWMNNRKLII